MISTQEAYTRILQEAIYLDEIDRRPFWGGFSRKEGTSCDPTLVQAVEQFNKEGMTEGTALDLGCSRSASALYLLEKGWNVIAVDYSQEALDNFEKLANGIDKKYVSSGRLTLVCADLETYEFPKNIDLIVSSRTFPYCNPKTIKGIWDKIFDSLALGGCLVGTFFPRPRIALYEHFTRAVMGTWYTDKETVQALLDSKYYETKVCRYSSLGFPMPAEIQFLAKKIGYPITSKGNIFSFSSYHNAVRGLPYHSYFTFCLDRIVDLREISKALTMASVLGTIGLSFFRREEATLAAYTISGSLGTWFLTKHIADWLHPKALKKIAQLRSLDHTNRDELRAIKKKMQGFGEIDKVQQLFNPPPLSDNPLKELLREFMGDEVEKIYFDNVSIGESEE